MAWEPLPTGEGANPLIRRLKAIDAEIYGHIYAQSGTIGGDVTIEGDLTGNDILSSNWVSGGGTYPATSLPDASATEGYYLDASAGDAQFAGDIWADGYVYVGADIVLDGGTFRSDTYAGISEAGITIDSAFNNTISFYTGHTNEYAAGSIHTTSTEPLTTYMQSPSALSGKFAKISLASESYSTTVKAKAVISTPESQLEVGSSGVMSGLEVTGDWLLQETNTASAPSYSFYGDTGAGMYRYDSDIIGWATGGTRRMALDTAAIYGEGGTGTPAIRTSAGVEATPTYSWDGNTGTGMYRVTTNTIGWSAAATNIMQLTSTYLRMGPTGTYTPILYVGTKSTNPSFTFSGDATTGMGRGTAGQVILYSAGTAELYLSGTQFVVPNVYNDSTTGSADVLVQTNGRLQRTTSAAKYKENIKTADWLADTPLRPVEFDSLLDKGVHAYGLIADEVAAALPDAGKYGDDGDVENYDTRAVIAVLVAKVNRLEEEVRELKSGNN